MSHLSSFFALEVLNSANEGITLVDMEQQGQPLIYINSAFEKLTGYLKEEILYKNCRFLQSGLPKQPETALIREALEKRQSCRVILQNVRKNGELFWNELSLAPVRQRQKTSFYVGIQKEVTQVIRQGKVLTDNLEKNRMLTIKETVSALANEINQPLSAIATYSKSCHLLMQGQEGKKEDKINDSLEKIEFHALVAGEIINRLNTSFNEWTLPRERVNVNQLINQTVAMLAFGYHSPVVLELEPGLPDVQVTPMHLTQVILNLIRNSVEAFHRVSQQDGKMVIQTLKKQDVILINFIDNGPGMPLAFRHRDIDTFFTSKPYGVGTGFGICKKLLALYGGTLQVTSRQYGLLVECRLPIS